MTNVSPLNYGSSPSPHVPAHQGRGMYRDFENIMRLIASVIARLFGCCYPTHNESAAEQTQQSFHNIVVIEANSISIQPFGNVQKELPTRTELVLNEGHVTPDLQSIRPELILEFETQDEGQAAAKAAIPQAIADIAQVNAEAVIAQATANIVAIAQAAQIARAAAIAQGAQVARAAAKAAEEKDQKKALAQFTKKYSFYLTEIGLSLDPVSQLKTVKSAVKGSVCLENAMEKVKEEIEELETQIKQLSTDIAELPVTGRSGKDDPQYEEKKSKLGKEKTCMEEEVSVCKKRERMFLGQLGAQQKKINKEIDTLEGPLLEVTEGLERLTEQGKFISTILRLSKTQPRYIEITSLLKERKPKVKAQIRSFTELQWDLLNARLGTITKKEREKFFSSEHTNVDPSPQASIVQVNEPSITGTVSVMVRDLSSSVYSKLSFLTTEASTERTSTVSVASALGSSFYLFSKAASSVSGNVREAAIAASKLRTYKTEELLFQTPSKELVGKQQPQRIPLISAADLK